MILALGGNCRVGGLPVAEYPGDILIVRPTMFAYHSPVAVYDDSSEISFHRYALSRCAPGLSLNVCCGRVISRLAELVGYSAVFYGGLLCLSVAGLLIFAALTKTDHRESNNQILIDEHTPYVRVPRIKLWHKVGLGVSILCVFGLVSYGVVRQIRKAKPVGQAEVNRTTGTPANDAPPTPAAKNVAQSDSSVSGGATVVPRTTVLAKQAPSRRNLPPKEHTSESSQLEAVNSVIENAGQIDHVQVSEAKVSSAENGRATVLNNLPGGSASDIRIDKPSISSTPSAPPIADGPALHIGRPTRGFQFEGNVYCNDDESFVGVHEGGKLENGTIRDNVPLNCYWVDILSAFANDRINLEANVDKFSRGCETSWENIPADVRRKNRVELSNISDELLNAPEDKFSEVIRKLMQRAPNFDVRYGWLALRQ